MNSKRSRGPRIEHSGSHEGPVARGQFDHTLSFLEAEANGQSSFNGKQGSASGDFRAMAGVRSQLNAKGSLGNEDSFASGHGNLSTDALLGAEASGSAEGAFDLENLSANGHAELAAFAGARISGQADGGLDFGDLSLDASAEGEAMAGAEANGVLDGSISEDGLELAAEGEAFAGAKAEGSTNFGIGGNSGNWFSMSLGGSANAGIGASGHADFEATRERVGLSLGAGLTFGLGADADIGLAFHPDNIINDVSGFASSVSDTVGGWMDDPMQFGSDALDMATAPARGLINGAMDIGAGIGDWMFGDSSEESEAVGQDDGDSDWFGLW